MRDVVLRSGDGVCSAPLDVRCSHEKTRIHGVYADHGATGVTDIKVPAVDCGVGRSRDDVLLFSNLSAWIEAPPRFSFFDSRSYTPTL